MVIPTPRQCTHTCTSALFKTDKSITPGTSCMYRGADGDCKWLKVCYCPHLMAKVNEMDLNHNFGGILLPIRWYETVKRRLRKRSSAWAAKFLNLLHGPGRWLHAEAHHSIKGDTWPPHPHMTAHMQVVQWSAVESIQITTIWKIMGWGCWGLLRLPPPP